MRRTILPILSAAFMVALATAVLGRQIYDSRDVSSMPVVVTKVNPNYTAQARDRRIEGDVSLEAIVGVDGTVGDVKVVQSLDSEFGLDQQAINALKQWIFKPALKDGKAVAVRVQVKMSFTLK